MGSRKQTILVVSDDAALCTAARREFEARIAGVRVASVTSVAAAKRILEEDAPAVILFEEASIAPEGDGPRGIARVAVRPARAGAHPATAGGLSCRNARTSVSAAEEGVSITPCSSEAFT